MRVNTNHTGALGNTETALASTRNPPLNPWACPNKPSFFLDRDIFKLSHTAVFLLSRWLSIGCVHHGYHGQSCSVLRSTAGRSLDDPIGIFLWLFMSLFFTWQLNYNRGIPILFVCLFILKWYSVFILLSRVLIILLFTAAVLQQPYLLLLLWQIGQF